MMSEIVYQYQQAYVPNNGNTFHFWVDCTKEIHDEEAREGGTVRTLYTAPPAPVLRVPAGWIKCSERMPEEHQSTDYVSEEVLVFTSDGEVEISFTDYGRWNCLELVTHWMPLPAPPEASNDQR